MNRLPKRLTGDAAAKWKVVAPTLEDLNAMEQELLCQYCESYAIYIRAAKEIAGAKALQTMAANGASCPIASIATQNKAIDQMRRLFQLLSKRCITAANEEEEFDV